MSLLLTLFSILLTYFTPKELGLDFGPNLQKFILFPAIVGTLVLIAKQLRIQQPQHTLILGFWFAIVVSLLTNPWLGGALHAFINFAVIVCVFFLVSFNSYSPGRIRAIYGALALCGFMLAVQGIMAYHFGYQAQKLMVYPGRINGYGILNDPNDLAQFLLVAFALLGTFWKRDALILNCWLVLPAATIMYAIFLTYSRGAIIGFAAMLLLLISTKTSRSLAAIITIIVFLVLLAIGAGGGRQLSIHEASAAGRVIAWGSGISDLKAHPLFGVGYGIFTNYNDLTAHNSFVLCFAELGLFGYFFWLGLIISTVVGLERLARSAPKTADGADLSGLVTVSRAALYNFLVTSWFLSRTYNETLYILLAVCGSLIHLLPATKPDIPALKIPWARLTVLTELASVAVVYILVRIRTI